MTRAAPAMGRALAVAAALVLAGPGPAPAQPTPPELSGPVNDFAGVIDPATRAELDRIIRALQSASGDVVVVATVKTFQPSPDIRVYANEMFENHGKGIGSKDKDNGLLLLLAVDDRQVWIEVGYDLEAIITDGFAGETSRQVMVPYFRKGDYSGGMLAGASAIIGRIAQARNVTLDNLPVARARERDDDELDVPYVLLLLMLFGSMQLLAGLVRALTGRGRRRRSGRWVSHAGSFGGGYSGWGGGWSGGGGGGFGGFGGGSSGGGGGGASW
ncbi:MAG: TPM domain-containing protein [Acidobacteriota bacterium]